MRDERKREKERHREIEKETGEEGGRAKDVAREELMFDCSYLLTFFFFFRYSSS